MQYELSILTLSIIAWSKILLVLTIAGFFYLYLKVRRPWAFALFFSIMIAAFYLFMSFPLQKMLWGNNGDEMFILALLGQALFDNPFSDFYYNHLPTFYPPLYFWGTGIFSRLFAQNAVTAAKAGVTLTIFFWFAGTYFWARFYKLHIASKKVVLNWNNYLPLIFSFLFFALVDFNDIVLKPYEVVTAMWAVLWLGFFAHEIAQPSWMRKHYLFFGISGGLIFLTYYFWWLLLLPVLLVLVLAQKEKFAPLKKVCWTGLIMFLVSTPFLIPLFASYRFGIENWQAFFFVPTDFNSFLPYTQFSWKLAIVLFGIAGLIFFYKEKLVQSNVWLLGMMFLYQLVSIVRFLLGKFPVQAAKPFLFLGSAVIALGATLMIVELWKKYITGREKAFQQKCMIVAAILSVPFLPMASFIDDPIVRDRIEKGFVAPEAVELASFLREQVPDAAQRTWLSSGIPDLNAYVSMHYYIAHNPHFSHHAARYSERMQKIRELAQADETKFALLLDEMGVDAIVLYRDSSEATYPLLFWQDNYPNGGRELQIDILRANVHNLGWQRFDFSHWVVFLAPKK